MSCPSDGDQEGFRPVGSGNGNGQDIAANPPPPPGGGTPMVAVSDYGSQLRRQLLLGPVARRKYVTETPPSLWPNPPGYPRIGWPGYQGTYADIGGNLPPTGAPGSLRGMYDVNNGQTVKIAGVTDGTSNTIAAGEVLPPSVPTTTCGNGTRAAMERRFRSISSPSRAARSRATAGIPRTRSRGVPTQTPASRATTPVAATSCSLTAPFTSSSSRFPW